MAKQTYPKEIPACKDSRDPRIKAEYSPCRECLLASDCDGYQLHREMICYGKLAPGWVYEAKRKEEEEYDPTNQ